MLKKIILFILSTALLFADKDDYNASQNAIDLNLYYQDYNFLMGEAGVLVGVIFLGITLYLITSVKR